MTQDKLSKKKYLAIEEQKKLFKNKKVVQLKKFIKGDVSAFSVNDLKIFKLIISKVNSKDSLFRDFYEITTDEIRALNINEKHLYSETRKTLKRLANIYITFEEENAVREVGLIRNDFKFEKYSKRILINFNDDMSEYLVNLQKNFFMYDLIDIVNFKFKHTLKFYEYIKSSSLNVLKLKIDTIKGILDLSNKYARYTNFKHDVLEVILEEINECSNTLFISYTEEKAASKVEYIVFHIKRLKNDLLLEANINTEDKFSYLIGKECEYLNKFYILQTVDLNNNLIVLQEKATQNYTNIVKDNELGVEEVLKSLFADEFKESEIKPKEQSEIKRLLAVKDFRKFKEEVIVQYMGQSLAVNVPGFEEDEIIAIQQDTGYLISLSNNKVITKEESLIIWKHLYNNRELIGKIIHKDPVKEFVNSILYINKTNAFGEKEICKYMICDIKEEITEDNSVKYRLYIQNINDPLEEEEKAKSLLTIEQLRLFVEENTKNNYSFQNE